MKIVIVGAGQVGATLAENLAREYNDITVVDINENALRANAGKITPTPNIKTCCLTTKICRLT